MQAKQNKGRMFSEVQKKVVRENCKVFSSRRMCFRNVPRTLDFSHAKKCFLFHQQSNFVGLAVYMLKFSLCKNQKDLNLPFLKKKKVGGQNASAAYPTDSPRCYWIGPSRKLLLRYIRRGWPPGEPHARAQKLLVELQAPHCLEFLCSKENVTFPQVCKRQELSCFRSSRKSCHRKGELWPPPKHLDSPWRWPWLPMSWPTIVKIVQSGKPLCIVRLNIVLRTFLLTVHLTQQQRVRERMCGVPHAAS